MVEIASSLNTVIAKQALHRRFIVVEIIFLHHGCQVYTIVRVKLHSHLIVASLHYRASLRTVENYILTSWLIGLYWLQKLNYKSKNSFALRELKPASLNSSLLKVSLGCILSSNVLQIKRIRVNGLQNNHEHTFQTQYFIVSDTTARPLKIVKITQKLR